MLCLRMYIFSCIAIAIILPALGALSEHSFSSPHYSIVIDAGSTGTRAFVFHESKSEDGSLLIKSYSCGKERMGLSSFSSNHSALDQLFTNLLATAASIIPSHFHRRSALYIRGTAGMRLLDEHDQDRLWDSTVLYLKNRADVPFLIERKNFGTISGHQEAFYAVLASNYIAGTIDGELR